MPAALSPCGDAAQSPRVGARHSETVSIFDWDDTLLASSYLASKGFNRLDEALHRSPELDHQLKLLEAAVVAVLSRAAEFGRVHIITNAETGWVQLSAQTFLPGVLPMLDKVMISSARSQYEPVFPASPVQWKYCAFHDKIVSGFACGADGAVERNVVSLGDSRVEREAVLTVCRGLPQTRCKSIKFAERPSLEQLRMQLELITQCFGDICTHAGDLDLQLSLSLSEPSSPASSPPASCPSTPALTPTRAPSTPVAAPVAMETDCMPQPQPQPQPARVQLVGYQPLLALAPVAVACGASSTLVVQPNGAASVVPASASASASSTSPNRGSAAAAAAAAAAAKTVAASTTVRVCAAAAAAAAAALRGGVEAVNGVVTDDMMGACCETAVVS